MTLLVSQQSISTQPAAQNKAALGRVFQAINPDSCPTLYNFHLHTVCSDGKLRPEEVMEQALRIGLKGLAITDHHSVKGYYAAQRWLDEWWIDHSNLYQSDRTVAELPQAPQLWTGVEINAGLLNTEVHILGYAFNPEHPRMQPYLQGHVVEGLNYQASQVIHAIQSAGGLAVLAHPARYAKRSPEDLIPEAAYLGIDGIETYYAYKNPNPWKSSPKQTAKVYELGATYGLLNTCGTDTHGSNLLLRL